MLLWLLRGLDSGALVQFLLKFATRREFGRQGLFDREADSLVAKCFEKGRQGVR